MVLSGESNLMKVGLVWYLVERSVSPSSFYKSGIHANRTPLSLVVGGFQFKQPEAVELKKETSLDQRSRQPERELKVDLFPPILTFTDAPFTSLPIQLG